MKSFFENIKIFVLAEAKSEVRKQECRADFLDSSVRDLQNNLIPIVWKSIVPIKALKNLEMSKPDFMKNQLSEKEYCEKLKSEVIHEVGELKRAQEMRMDEFSRNELKESHSTIQELTSQVTGAAGINELY